VLGELGPRNGCLGRRPDEPGRTNGSAPAGWRASQCAGPNQNQTTGGGTCALSRSEMGWKRRFFVERVGTGRKAGYFFIRETFQATGLPLQATTRRALRWCSVRYRGEDKAAQRTPRSSTPRGRRPSSRKIRLGRGRCGARPLRGAVGNIQSVRPGMPGLRGFGQKNRGGTDRWVGVSSSHKWVRTYRGSRAGRRARCGRGGPSRELTPPVTFPQASGELALEAKAGGSMADYRPYARTAGRGIRASHRRFV